jgi:hypothetical protein
VSFTGSLRELENHPQMFYPLGKGGYVVEVFKILLTDAKNDYRMIDSTIVRAHQQAASGKVGAKTRPWGVPEVE